MIWARIEQQIREQADPGFRLQHKEHLPGGCIDETWKISGNGSHWFVKTSTAGGALTYFQREAEGLRALTEAGLNTPEVIGYQEHEGTAWLLLAYVDMGGGQHCQAELGRQLAQAHRQTAAQFGWHADNRIGATPQHNGWMDNWLDFWRERRLLPQLQWLQKRAPELRLLDRAQPLLQNLDAFFNGYRPEASLLHGDLWSGNAACGRNGQPVVFDPACYYGDRETDLAMTELFGGFSGSFYQAYNQAWPLDAGYSQRKPLYNFYHILNHANLFGGGYGMQAARLLETLLQQL